MAPATKATQKRLDAAVAAFNTRYSAASQWTEDRWYGSLYAALARPTKYCAVLNLFAVDGKSSREILSPTINSDQDDTLRNVHLPSLTFNPEQGQDTLSKGCDLHCYEHNETNEQDNKDTPQTAELSFPAPKAHPSSPNHLFTHWNLDAASVLAAHMLDVQPGDAVLDMCAAPGGKTIVLAQSLFPHLHRDPEHLSSSAGSILHVNEFDAARYKRLTLNLKSYLPETLFPSSERLQAPVKILNKDLSMKQSISSLPLGADAYDKILIDAPCSSERHIIHAYEKAKAAGRVADEMLNWKASHAATLVKTQAGLLQTALKAVKIGGRIVYATCALGFEENDGVVDKVLMILKTERQKAKKNGDPVDPWDIECLTGTESIQSDMQDPVLDQITERTRYGRIALPDHGGWGPLYFCIMVKKERKRSVNPKTKRSTKSIVRVQASNVQTEDTPDLHNSMSGNELSQSIRAIHLRDTSDDNRDNAPNDKTGAIT